MQKTLVSPRSGRQLIRLTYRSSFNSIGLQELNEFVSKSHPHTPRAVARSAGYTNIFALLVLGFRCASPQGLRCHPLRGLNYQTAELIHISVTRITRDER